MAQTQMEIATEEALSRLARARDGEAWGVLLERHGPAVDRVCRRILGDETLAEDACQETWLQVRALAGRFRVRGGDVSAHEAAARGWVLAIAANVALHMQRKRRRDRNRDDSHARNRPQASSGEDAAVDRERADAVHRELAALGEADRMPIVMHYYGGLGYAELAAALDCPVGTAKARVSRGLEKLRQRLALLGLLLALGELDSFLGGSEAHAAEGAAVSEAALSQERLARWRELLGTTREPAMPGMAPNRGVSTMTKVTAVGVAALLAAGIALWAKPGNGADGNGESEAGGAYRQTGVAEVNTDPNKPPTYRPVRTPAERTEISPAKAEPAVPPAPVAAPPADPDKPATAEEKTQAVGDLNAAAVDVYRAASKGEEGNVFLSPYSISTALAMTYLGARGPTAAEMEKALHFAQRERVHASYAALIAEMNDAGGDRAKRPYALSVANRLFGQKGYPFEAAFLAQSKAFYGSGLAETNFIDRPAALKQINTWVEKQTQDKIKDLLALENLTPETRLVLVNTIYFKSDWANPFEKRWTQGEPFRLASGSKVTAPLMRATEHFNYLEDEGRLQVLELPYKNRALSMFVILPTAHDGLPAVEAALTAEDFSRWAKDAKSQRVTVVLPRFKTTWRKSLKSPLQALGMKLAFELGKPDFTAIAKVPGEPLLVGDVIHKAFVDVDEAGTEAAAATAVVMRAGSMPPADPPKQFRADRPFLYAIRHNASGAILFLGRVMDPTKE